MLYSTLNHKENKQMELPVQDSVLRPWELGKCKVAVLDHIPYKVAKPRLEKHL
jgi:hypothetical protein